MEKTDEWIQSGVIYDYGFRIYDSRVARFYSIDPLRASYPWYTPYQFAGNTPIQAVDLDGLEELHYALYKKLDGSIVMFKLYEKDIEETIVTGGLWIFGYFIATEKKTVVNRYSKVVMHFAYERMTLIPCNTSAKPCGSFYPVPWDTDRDEEYKNLNAAISDPQLEKKLDDKILSAKQHGLLSAVSLMGGLISLNAVRIKIAKSSSQSNVKTNTKIIYRAVGIDEFDDIQSSKLIRPHPKGLSMETKLFAETADDAFAQGVGSGKDFRVIQVEVTEEFYNKLYKTNTVDPHITNGRNTIAIDPDQITEFNQNIQSISSSKVVTPIKQATPVK